MDLALVGVATHLRLDSNKKVCKAVRIALGAVATTPIRAPEAEEAIINKTFDEDAATEAGRIASENISPRSSIRASREYRKEMVGVLVKKALMKSFERVQNTDQ